MTKAYDDNKTTTAYVHHNGNIINFNNIFTIETAP